MLILILLLSSSHYDVAHTVGGGSGLIRLHRSVRTEKRFARRNAPASCPIAALPKPSRRGARPRRRCVAGGRPAAGWINSRTGRGVAGHFSSLAGNPTTSHEGPLTTRSAVMALRCGHTLRPRQCTRAPPSPTDAVVAPPHRRHELRARNSFLHSAWMKTLWLCAVRVCTNSLSGHGLFHYS